MPAMEFDREKFKTLVLYIIWRAGERPGFGSTKLNKVLWFAEARASQALGRPLAGETYIRQKFGPVPKHIDSVLSELEQHGLITISTERFYDHPVTRYRAFSAVDVSAFNPDELSLIDWWIRHVDEEHATASTSERSHDYGWEIAKEGEVLPFHAFLASRIRDPRDEELEWAREQAKVHGIP